MKLNRELVISGYFLVFFVFIKVNWDLICDWRGNMDFLWLVLLIELIEILNVDEFFFESDNGDL